MSAKDKEAEAGTGTHIVVSTQPYYPFCEEYANEEDARARYDELIAERAGDVPGGRFDMYVYIAEIKVRSSALLVHA
jgi:hypothetical protein